jgi:hypothetical protein
MDKQALHSRRAGRSPPRAGRTASAPPPDLVLNEVTVTPLTEQGWP